MGQFVIYHYIESICNKYPLVTVVLNLNQLQKSRMGEWKEGLFSCFSDLKVCICAYFIPCYVQGKVGEAVGESCLICTLLVFLPLANCLAMVYLRGKVRDTKGIEGGLVGDLLAVWCCYPCALCQSAKEVDADLMAAETESIERV